jgi:hypothetical protein
MLSAVLVTSCLCHEPIERWRGRPQPSFEGTGSSASPSYIAIDQVESIKRDLESESIITSQEIHKSSKCC